MRIIIIQKIWLLFKAFSFSTDQEPWTGIYYCKGEKHQYQFYCGQGKCALDRKKKVRTCEDEEWSEVGNTFYLGKHYFDSHMDFRLAALI